MYLMPLFLMLWAAAQSAGPAAGDAHPGKEILNNRHVVARVLEIAPGEALPAHALPHDSLTIFVNSGASKNKLEKIVPIGGKIEAGEVRFHGPGTSEAFKNTGDERLRTVEIEFVDPQGKTTRASDKQHYCNPGSATACVDEKSLFCTEKVCVEDVTIAPGAVTTKHMHSTDHMLVAVSDYELTDTIEGKGTVVRARKSGEVEYISAGIKHQLTNTGKATAHFTVIVWR
jgi:quercetin dioxygenase-like cupin family protein